MTRENQAMKKEIPLGLALPSMSQRIGLARFWALMCGLAVGSVSGGVANRTQLRLPS